MLLRSSDRARYRSRGLPAPKLSAELVHSIVVGRGIGTLTFPTVSDSAGDRYVQDHEGIWRAVKAEEARFTGARRVENLDAESESISNWVAGGSGSITDATTADLSGGAFAKITGLNEASHFTDGDSYIGTVTLSGNGTVTLRVQDNDSVNNDSKTVTLTSTPQRFELAYTLASTPTFCQIVIDRNNGTATSVTVHNHQVENSTGRTDTTTPSEYVSTGVGTGNDIWDNDNITAGGTGATYTDNGNGTYTAEFTTSYGYIEDLTNANVVEGQTYVFKPYDFVVTTGSLKFQIDDGSTTDITSTYTSGNAFVFTASKSGTFRITRTSAATEVTWSNFELKRINHGANVDGVRYFPWENGNSVASNVVTEGTGAALGRNLIANNGLADGVTIGKGGHFIDTTGWTGNDAAAELSIASGNLRVNNGDTSGARGDISVTTVSGKVYSVFYHHIGGGSTNAQFRIGTTAGGGDLFTSGLHGTGGAGVQHTKFVATGTTTHISLLNTGATEDLYTDWAGIYITPGIPLKGLMGEGAATNLITQPRDLTNAAWTANSTATDALDAVGIDGQPNSASTSEDDNASSSEVESETVTITDDSNTNLLSVYVKKDETTSRFPLLYLKYTGGTQQDHAVGINTSTGEITDHASLNDGASGVIDAGDWWLVYITLANSGDGNTSATVNWYPAFGTTIAVQSVAATGTTVTDGFTLIQNTSYPTSPILKTGVTTRNADAGATLNLSNFSDGQGSMEFYLTPQFNGVFLSSNNGIINPYNGADRGIVFSSSVADRLFFHDGTNTISYTDTWAVAGQTIHVKVRWNDVTDKMNISVDGVAATEATYDGSFSPSGAITLFKSLTLGAEIKNLKMYNRDLGESWLTL